MVQSVGSWKPDKELPVKSKECEHEWNENMVTNYTICYYCGILTTDTSRLKLSKRSLFSKGVIQMALKSFDQLRIEKERLEEQKDEEIRELKSLSCRIEEQEDSSEVQFF
ncbi:hypothetical protein Tco_0483930 [Tanacetum coccineum]